MSLEQRTSLVRQLHGSNKRIVLATTGGGSLAISDLLTEPGATKTLLEAYVPYSLEALTRFLGQKPDQACSAQTARSLAMACFERGNNRQGNVNLLGIGCTASLASDRPKKGEHRVHIAVQSYNSTAVFSLTFKKGARTRQEEERLVADCLLKYLAEAAEISFDFSVPLLEEEHFTIERTLADAPVVDLLLGDTAAVLFLEGKPVFTKTTAEIGAPVISPQRLVSPEVEYMQNIFPGSFAPMHQGHLRMVELAQERLSGKIALEISIHNVDKPPLDYLEIEHRLRQIEERSPGQAVWLTRTTRFVDKSQLFRGATFLVGADTLKRIGDQKYYANNHSHLMDVLRVVTYCGCRFLVFARPLGEAVETLQTLTIPDMLRTLCEAVSEKEFCEDISSSGIRKCCIAEPQS